MGRRGGGREGDLICCAGTPPKRSSFDLSPAHMLRKPEASLPMNVSPPACACSRARVRPNSCARASARSRARSRARSLAARSCHAMPSIAQYNKDPKQAHGQQRLAAAHQARGWPHPTCAIEYQSPPFSPPRLASSLGVPRRCAALDAASPPDADACADGAAAGGGARLKAASWAAAPRCTCHGRTPSLPAAWAAACSTCCLLPHRRPAHHISHRAPSCTSASRHGASLEGYAVSAMRRA